jgi:O-antigen ligase
MAGYSGSSDFEVTTASKFTFPWSVRRNSRLAGWLFLESLLGVVGPAAAIIVSAGIGYRLATHDPVSVLRIAVGLAVVLVLLRYPYALLLSWVLIGPFLGSNVPILSGNNFDTVLTVPTLLLVTVAPLRDIFRRVPALPLLFTFFFWILLGIGVSPLDPVSFLKAWTLFLDYGAVAVLAIHLLSQGRSIDRFLDALLVSPSIISVYGIYGYFTGQNVISTGNGPARITSIFNSAPPLALLLSIAVPVALYRVTTTRGWGRVLSVGSTLVLLIAIVLTFSRGVIISLAVCLIIAIPLVPTRRVRVFLTSLAVTSFVAVLVWGSVLLERFANTDIGTLNGRTVLWRVLADRFDPTQVLGNGFGASDIVVAGMQITRGYAASTSNLYVAVLYDHGIVGLALLLLAFVVLGFGLIRELRKATGNHRLLFLVGLVALVNGLILSIEVSDLLTQSVAVYFWIISGVPFAYGRMRGIVSRGINVG